MMKKKYLTSFFMLASLVANAQVGIGTTTPASGFEINTSMGLKVTTITSATTLDQTHNVVLCNTGPYTVTLPAAATNTGKIYYIKNIDAEGDNITIDGNGSETIEGKTGFLLDQQNLVIRIISDGSNWHVIEQSTPTNSFIANCDGSGFTWNDVVSTTGKTWMDRNLGASQVATSIDDANGEGDLYQWGRLKDGHQCRTSGTTSNLSSSDVPGHDDFIINSGDWRSPSNDNLWQGVNGINNPCPDGYRIPTTGELTEEMNSWTTRDHSGAFASNLKLTTTATRRNTDALINNYGNPGNYWSSTRGVRLLISASTQGTYVSSWTYNGGNGSAIRCIKDY